MNTMVIQKWEAQGNRLLSEANSICIVDSTTREIAVEFTMSARKVIGLIEDEFKPDIQKAHELHKGLLDRLKKLIAPFMEARRIVDGEIRRDYLEQERVRQEAERKAQAKVEAERQAQEVQRMVAAEERIDAGDLEEAEKLLDAEIIVNPIIPMAQVQKTTQSDAGSATVKRDIVVILVDLRQVITAVYEGRLPNTLLTVDLGMAKRYAKASGLMTMPGFHIEETAVVSGRVR